MNNSNYYRKQLLLVKVNKPDKIIGSVERWQAHEKGILHRGFTAIIECRGKFLLQKRKHPAFDCLWDLTFSSHPLIQNGILQTDKEAILNSLKREWIMTNTTVLEIKSLGKIYYEAKDPKSVFTEHEYDYIYVVRLDNFPEPNGDFAYETRVINEIRETRTGEISERLAPWVKKIINSSILI